MASAAFLPQFIQSISIQLYSSAMLQYLPPESPPVSSSAIHDSQIYLPMQAGNPPGSTTPPSSTINVSRVYTTLVQTNSYKEMLGITRSMDQEDSNHQMMLTQMLRPNREHVIDALKRSKSSVALANLISSYFRYSEETTSLCLCLQQRVAEVRRLYWPLHTVVDDQRSDSLSRSDCDLVFDEFLKFDGEANPFPSPDSDTFNGIRDLFCDLKLQLERRLRKSSSRIRLVRYTTAEPTGICCVGGAVCTAYIPSKFARRELAYAAQLKVASKNTYVLKTDLDTLDSLVGRLYYAVENDKRFIRLGLKIGNDKHTVQEVLKELGNNHQKLVEYLVLLEEKICTCYKTVNDSRSQLLHEILLHSKSSNS